MLPEVTVPTKGLLVKDGALQDGSKGERHKSIPVGFVKLVLELHPVQAQRVEEALEHVHAEQDASGHGGEDGKALKEKEGAQRKGKERKVGSGGQRKIECGGLAGQ